MIADRKGNIYFPQILIHITQTIVQTETISGHNIHMVFLDLIVHVFLIYQNKTCTLHFFLLHSKNLETVAIQKSIQMLSRTLMAATDSFHSYYCFTCIIFVSVLVSVLVLLSMCHVSRVVETFHCSCHICQNGN